MKMTINRHTIASSIKKILYPFGETYSFGNRKLYFKTGTRPVKKKYILSENDVVRNDVLQIKYLEENFKPGDVFWDIGSHYGQYSIFAASVVKDINQVFSFEPDKDARKIQVQNIHLNHFEDKIKIFDFALSNAEGVAEFSSQGGNANSHLIKNSSNGTSYRNIVQVKSKTLNSLSKELPLPAFVKIDTEGAEVDIIKEASGLLAQKDVKFICELHPFAWSAMNVNYYELRDIVLSYGRTITPLDSKKNMSDLPFYGTVLF